MIWRENPLFLETPIYNYPTFLDGAFSVVSKEADRSDRVQWCPLGKCITSEIAQVETDMQKTLFFLVENRSILNHHAICLYVFFPIYQVCFTWCSTSYCFLMLFLGIISINQYIWWKSGVSGENQVYLVKISISGEKKHVYNQYIWWNICPSHEQWKKTLVV